jgi:hypothetical protein
MSNKTTLPEGHPLLRFSNFAEVCWDHLNLPALTPVQIDICDWLQYGPKRSQTHAFRGVGKSYLCSAYAVWSLFLNLDEKVLVVSASKVRADEFVRFCRRLIEDIPMLQHMIPDRLDGDRDSTISFDVRGAVTSHVPSLKSIGMTGQITGSRGSLIILDDIEVVSNSSTPSQREKLSTTAMEVDAVILPESVAMGVDPRIRVLGTPQSMETVYHQLTERGYVPRVWPIQIPNEETVLGYRGALAPMVQDMIDSGAPEGTPTEPSRFHIADIAERRMSYGSMNFALQFLLSTALSDAEKYPLKVKDLIFASFTPERAKEVYVHSNHPQFKLKGAENVGMQGDGFYMAADAIGEWKTFDRTVVAVDPSGRGKDETAIISGSMLGGQAFIHRVQGTLDGYGIKTLEAVAHEARRVKATLVIVEDNFGDGMWANLLRPVMRRIYPCTIEDVKVKGNKEMRIIDTLAPAFEAHKVVMHDAIPNSDRVPHTGDLDSELRSRDRQLFYQATHLTAERGCLAHDDRLDCLALLVSHFAEYMNLDADAEMRAREEEAYRAFEDKGIIIETTDSWIAYGDPGTTSMRP